MTPWVEAGIYAAPVLGGIFLYLVRLESKLAKMSTDLEWLKKALDRRRRPRG